MNYLVNPTMNLQAVVDQAKPSDVIDLAEGIYTKGVELKVSGVPEAPITLHGLGRVEFKTPGQHNVLTSGMSHWRFGRLHSSESVSAFEIDRGSTDIGIDGLRVEKNRFSVRVRLGSLIRTRHAYGDHCNNAFKVMAGDDILFEDCEAYRSNDDFDPDATYLNGDGFIVERGVTNLVIRRCKSGEHKDGGFDIKSKALLEDCITWACKNNLKMWGLGTLLRNCLSYDAKRQPKAGGFVEGNCLTLESKDGVHAQVTAERCTFDSAQNFNLHLYGDSVLTLKECVIAHDGPLGELYGKYNGPGTLVTNGNVWFDAKRPRPSYVPATDLWAMPDLVDHRSTSFPMVGITALVPPIDALAWDQSTTPPAPTPVPTPPPTVPPAPTPVPPGALVLTLPRKSASSSSLRYADDKAKVSLTLPTKLLPEKPMKVTVTI